MKLRAIFLTFLMIHPFNIYALDYEVLVGGTQTGDQIGDNDTNNTFNILGTHTGDLFGGDGVNVDIFVVGEQGEVQGNIYGGDNTSNIFNLNGIVTGEVRGGDNSNNQYNINSGSYESLYGGGTAGGTDTYYLNGGDIETVYGSNSVTQTININGATITSLNLGNSDNTIIFNSGSITGLISAGTGTDSFTLNGDLDLLGNMSNINTVQINGGGILNLKANILGSTSITNAGTIYVQGADRSIEGELSNTGQLKFDIDSGNLSGKLSVTGNSNLNGSIYYNINGTGDNNVVAVGQTRTIRVIDTTNLISSNIINNSNDNSLLVDFSTKVVGDNIEVDITRKPILSYASSTYSSLASAIEASGGGVLNRLDSAADQTELNNALAETSPSLNLSSSEAIYSTASKFKRTIFDRLNNKTLGVSSGDSYELNNMWLSGFVVDSKQRQIGDVLGYRSISNGIIVGTEYELSPKNTIGVSFNYSKTNITDDGTSPDHVGIKNYRLAAYNNYILDKHIFNSMLSISYDRYKRTRNINIGGITEVATSSNSGKSLTAVGMYKQNFKANNWILTPSIETKLSTSIQNRFSENSTSALALQNVKNSSVTRWDVGIGKRFTYLGWNEDNNIITQLYGKLNYLINSAKSSKTANFAGGTSQSFTIDTPTLSRTSANAGINLSFNSNESLKLTMGIDIGLRKKFISKTAFLNFRFSY